MSFVICTRRISRYLEREYDIKLRKWKLELCNGGRVFIKSE